MNPTDDLTARLDARRETEPDLLPLWAYIQARVDAHPHSWRPRRLLAAPVKRADGRLQLTYTEVPGEGQYAGDRCCPPDDPSNLTGECAPCPSTDTLLTRLPAPPD